MDTFFEQIISIKKTGSALLSVVGIWALALIISAILILFPILGSLTALIIFGVLFGAFKLAARFNIEYEYIVTNGSMDVDKIINKSSRKRMASFDISGISRIEKFHSHLLNNVDKKALVVACNLDDPNAYYMVCEREGKGAVHVVFAPEERLKGAIVKSLPKFIANSAFK